MPFIHFSGHIIETKTTNTNLKEVAILNILIWFSLSVREECSVFQLYVFCWLQVFGYSLYQVKRVSF